MPVTDRELEAFCDALWLKVDSHYEANFPSLDPPAFTYERGPKYTRIVQTDASQGGDRRVFCFVDNDTGFILKAHSWRRPALGTPRGHISNGANDVTPWGAKYLK
jgi:hypothetical protein